MTNRRAVVIGAGLGGLATSIRLADAGWDVTVLEQGPRIGGKMNRFERDGFKFDTGPSLITLPYVFERLFKLGGIDFQGTLNPVRIDPLFEYRFASGTRLTYSSSLPDLTAEIERVTGSREEVSGLYEFLRLGARIFNLSERTFFERPPFERPRLKDIPMLFSAPKRHAWGNYKKAVRHHFRSPELRQIFERYPTYVGASPDDAVGTLALIPFMEMAFGGWYVPGGLYRIVEVLSEIATRLGVKIKTDARVTELNTEDNRVVGVTTADDEYFESDVVVSNADPSAVHSFAGSAAGVELNAQQRSMSGFVLLVGMNRKLEGIRHHTVCFSSDYDLEFSQIFKERRFPDDPTVYVNTPSITDHTVAPPGCEAIFLMANTPADPEQWTPEFEREAVGRVRKRLVDSGMPDIISEASFVESWTPAKLEREYSAPGGAIYGQVSHGWKGTFMRPPLKDKKVKGLFYVGGGTHPGGGTPTVLMSAEIVSRMIGAPSV